MGTNYYSIPKVEDLEIKRKKLIEQIQTMDISNAGLCEDDFRMYEEGDGYYFRMRACNNFSNEDKKITTDILNEYGFKVVDFSPFEVEGGGDRYYNASVSFI